MATPSGNEEVRYDILIEAKAAIQAMRDMLKYTSDNTTKMTEFTNQVMKDSKRWGVSWQQALLVYKQLNAELAKQKKATLFGQTGGQDLFGQSAKYLTALEEAGRLQANVSKGAEDMGNKVESAGKRGARGMDVMRIALGAIVSMILFRAIQAIDTFFRGAIEQARQFEDTLYRLRNVEESLSLAGIEISMEGLKKGITDIQKLLPIFSKEDVAQLVGNLAISTKQLGLNEQQILDLAKAIGILNVRSEKQEDLSTTAQHVLSSLLTGNAKGITSLGIAFTDNVMRAKAMELGFLDAGEALSTLTENEKGLTKLQIILASTAKETENIGEYMDSNSAKIAQNAAAWKDLQTTVGQVLLPFIPVLIESLKALNGGFQALKVVLIELGVAGLTFQKIWTAITTLQPLNIDQMKEDIASLREELVNQFFKEVPEDAPEWFKQGWGGLIKKEAETATGPLQELGEAIEEIDLSEFEQKIQEIKEGAEESREDLAEKLARKLEDLDKEYQRKAIDAEVDYLRKVDDINTDYQRSLAALKHKHREEDEQDEAKYQLALWELRQRFLMNLEDALHARDARQVIRLQKEYKLDKEALRRKHELESKERESGQQAEIDDLELRRQQRLADARLEYEQKLADLHLAKQREQEDLDKWYKREQADIELAMQRKLESLIKAWIEEQKITEANAAAVYGILLKYFGPGGLTDGLYQYMTQSLIASTQGAIVAAAASISSAMSSFGNLTGAAGTSSSATSIGTSGTSTLGSGSTQTKPGRDAGLIPTLTNPSSIPDMNLAPLGQIGRNAGMGTLSGKDNGVNGQIKVFVDLSPDLEGRIVSQSMDGVAEVIGRVGRMK